MEFCAYCQKEADGAMLSIGGALSHVGCAIDALNRVLDPDYHGNGEPIKIIGNLEQARIEERKWIGEWIEKHYSITLLGGIADYTFLHSDLDALRQGRLPEGVK